MAGLYITLEKAAPERLKCIAERLRYSDEVSAQWIGDVSFSWLSHDPADRFAPARDLVTGVRVVIGGRTVWGAIEWHRAKELPFEGGLASRLILDRYLQHGPKGVTPYNGAAVIFIWDPRTKTAHAWTDQFGYHPGFVYGKDSATPTVFTSFPDAIRADSEADSTPDEVSMAEFLRAWRATPPNTYYRYLKHAGPGMHWEWNLGTGTVSSKPYWTPFEEEFFRTEDEAADALADALRLAVNERTAISDKTAIFISGGADSRVMLFGADDPKKITGINLYESEPTEESRIAEALCKRVGAQYIGFGRDNDYYPRLASEIVKWSGAMWSMEDSHYLGVRDVALNSGADLVMSACTTDWIFKGYGLEKTYRKFLGKYLPLKRLLSERVDGFLPNYPLEGPKEMRHEIDARMSAWFAGTPQRLESDRDHLLVEDRRVRPACYTVSVSGQMMYRIYPYDTFLADSRLADCYSRIPAWMKLNGSVWGKATSRMFSDADDIVDSNFGWPVNASPFGKLMFFAKGWIGRRVKRMAPAQKSSKSVNHPPCYASWPELGWYATNSPTVTAMWEDQSCREELTRVWGSDPWDVPLEKWVSSGLDFFRILTLLQYLRSNR